MDNLVKPKGAQPDFKGDGVAVWINTDKNGNKYLSIKVLGSIQLAAFKNEPKPEPKKEVADEVVEELFA